MDHGIMGQNQISIFQDSNFSLKESFSLREIQNLIVVAHKANNNPHSNQNLNKTNNHCDHTNLLSC